MTDKINKDASKEEIESFINNKNRKQLNSTDAIGDLLTYNLENFAFRYLETTTDKNIKCQSNGNDYYVQSIESDILEALKWENKTLKKRLIQLCKEFPGSKSKDLKVRLTLGSKIISKDQVQCYSEVNWSQHNFSKDENYYIEKNVMINYEDPLDLRNTHAKYLEEVATIF